VSATIISSLVSLLHHLSPALVYTVVALLVFGEAAILVGFVLPGETTVLVAGVIASQGSINIVALCVLVVLAAIIGDSVGYLIGREFGVRLLDLKPLQRHRDEIDRALTQLERRGPHYVFIGRFTAFLRAVMPGLAGISRLHYRRFFIANALGALVWGIGCCLAGYAAGSQLGLVEKYIGYFSWGLLVIIVGIVATVVIRHRRRLRLVD